jgi:hypothetical protein
VGWGNGVTADDWGTAFLLSRTTFDKGLDSSSAVASVFVTDVLVSVSIAVVDDVSGSEPVAAVVAVDASWVNDESGVAG